MVLVNQVTHNHGLEAIHLDVADPSFLNEREIGSIAGAMRRTASLPARAGVTSALTHGEADALDVKIRHRGRVLTGLWFVRVGLRFAACAEPDAMVLSTVDPDGRPSGRYVLLKAADDRGFVFYTNLDSRKARALNANPFGSLCFYWPPLNKQVRVEGRIGGQT